MTVFGISFLAANVLAFIVFAIDKLLARMARRRIPEVVLLLFAFFGGATGAFLSMILCHHKTRKPLFYILVPLMMVAQLYLYVRWRFF